MNVLDFMTRFEEDALRFYETLDQEELNRVPGGLYTLLADSQRKHLENIRTIRETAQTKFTESALVERAGHVMNGFEEMLSVRDISKEMRSDRGAFSHVFHAENEMIKLCEGMARAEPDQNVRALLDWLAANEKRHLQEIEEIYDFVEAPGCYLEWGEFSNLRTL